LVAPRKIDPLDGLTHSMVEYVNMQKSYTKGDLYFAISNITLKRVKSVSRAIIIYKIS
jgi:hypothetical protein